jgi:hypothetical protein
LNPRLADLGLGGTLLLCAAATNTSWWAWSVPLLGYPP